MRHSRRRWTLSISTTPKVGSMRATIDLEDLGLDRGGHLLIAHALAALPIGSELSVSGRAPLLRVHARAWARSQGHAFAEDQDGLVVIKGAADEARRVGAERAGGHAPGEVVHRPGPTWGAAARGA